MGGGVRYLEAEGVAILDRTSALMLPGEAVLVDERGAGGRVMERHRSASRAAWQQWIDVLVRAAVALLPTSLRHSKKKHPPNCYCVGVFKPLRVTSHHSEITTAHRVYTAPGIGSHSRCQTQK